MEVQEAAQIMRYVEAAWPRSITKETVAAYVEGILDLPAAPTMRAVKDLARRSQFMPTIAEIREVVVDTQGLFPPSAPEALIQAEAFLKYQHQMGFVNGSGWQPVRPPTHPAVEACCRGLDADDFRWPSAFLRSYRVEASGSRDRVLTANPFDQPLGALGE